MAYAAGAGTVDFDPKQFERLGGERGPHGVFGLDSVSGSDHDDGV